MSDSIRKILMQPPTKMPWAHNNYIFSTDRSGWEWHKKLFPQLTDWVPNPQLRSSQQGKSRTLKDITIVSQPIEITPLETFKVEFKLPVHDEVELHLDGLFFKKLPECRCEMNILMRHGCQCGGI